MMLKLLILLFILALFLIINIVSSQEEGSQTLREAFFSETLNRDFQYNIILPAGYDASEERYPVIYLLHGRGDTGTAWLIVHDMLDELIANGEIPPFIAVLPDFPSSERASYYIDSQYTGSDFPAEAVETAFMNELIPHIDSNYRTVTEREGRLVGGYSMGGYGAIRYSMAYPELFKGALVLSPAVYVPLPPMDSSTREFGAFGNGESLFDADIYRSLNYPALVESVAESDLPLFFFIAVGDDEYHTPIYEERLHDIDMEAHLFYNEVVRLPRVRAELRVYDGGHDWKVWLQGFVEGMRFLGNQ
jgi:enterochelin esterase-like enzyme